MPEVTYEYTFVLDNTGTRIVDNLSRFIITAVTEVPVVPDEEAPSGGFAHEILTEIYLPVYSDVGFPTKIKFNVFGIKIDENKVTVKIKGNIAKHLEEKMLKVFGKIAKEELKEMLANGQIAKNTLHNPLLFGIKANMALIEAFIKGKVSTDTELNKEVSGKIGIDFIISYSCKGEKRNNITISYNFKGKKDFGKFLEIILDDDEE